MEATETDRQTATIEFGDFPHLLCTPEARDKIKEERRRLAPVADVLKELTLSHVQMHYSKSELYKFAKPANRKTRTEMTREDVMRRWPAFTAHIICASSGYATPECAAQILLDAAQGKENWCEWIACCYGCKPIKAVGLAIRGRAAHKGYMCDFKAALALVIRNILGFEDPLFASWF